MIFLIRHADALAGDVDAERPLSGRGMGQVERLGALLKNTGIFAPEEVWHSPLVRARETAELLVRASGIGAPTRLMPGLEPDDDPSPMAALLMESPRSLAVVGHEPHLGVLASMFVRGADLRPVYFPFPKAGVLALQKQGAAWVAEWLVRSP